MVLSGCQEGHVTADKHTLGESIDLLADQHLVIEHSRRGQACCPCTTPIAKPSHIDVPPNCVHLACGCRWPQMADNNPDHMCNHNNNTTTDNSTTHTE